jgi:hypothetical protein
MGNNGIKSMYFSNAGFDITGTANLVSVKVETLYSSQTKIMALCLIFI